MVFIPAHVLNHTMIYDVYTCIVMRIFQFDVMKRYLDTGGSILVLTGEGGEARFDTNVNFFLEEFGISVNAGEYVAYLVGVNLFIVFQLKLYKWWKSNT